MDKINFVNNSEPDLSAENLNLLQTNVENAINNVEQVKTYDLTQNITENVNSFTRITCKRQKNVVNINGFIKVSAIAARSATAILNNLPDEIISQDITDGLAISFSSNEIYRVYINTDKSVYIYSPGENIPENRQLSFTLSYII